MVRLCLICRDEDENVNFQTRCQHYFHKSCLEGWAAKMEQCPLCRGRISHDLNLEFAYILAITNIEYTLKNYGNFPIVLEFILYEIVLDGRRLDYLKNILKTGVDVNRLFMDNVTCLMVASAKGNLEFVQCLLAQGAEVNIKDDRGYTALHCASQFGKVAVIKMLMEHKADLNGLNRDSLTPLHMAVKTRNLEIIKLLCKGTVNVNTVDKMKTSPLHDTCLLEFLDAAKILALQTGVDFNIKNSTGHSPLHLASMSFNIDLIKLFLKHGADVNLKDNYGKTPLFYAIGTREGECIKFLIEHGAE